MRGLWTISQTQLRMSCPLFLSAKSVLAQASCPELLPVGGVEMTLALCSFSSRCRNTSMCKSPKKLHQRSLATLLLDIAQNKESPVSIYALLPRQSTASRQKDQQSQGQKPYPQRNPAPRAALFSRDTATELSLRVSLSTAALKGPNSEALSGKTPAKKVRGEIISRN